MTPALPVRILFGHYPMQSKRGRHGIRFWSVFGPPSLVAFASITTAALALPLGTGCDSHASSALSDPRVSEAGVASPSPVDQSSHTQEADIGIVPTGTTRDHLFTIANNASDEWILKGIRTSCLCTVATPDRAIVAPGQAVHVNIHYHAPPDSGEILRDTLVKFEPGPTFKLTIRGSVRAPLALSASLVEFRSRIG
jgi:hypothetical protein